MMLLLMEKSRDVTQRPVQHCLYAILCRPSSVENNKRHPVEPDVFFEVMSFNDISDRLPLSVKR